MGTHKNLIYPPPVPEKTKMIHRLPLNAKRFSTTVSDVRGSNATDRIQSRAERDAAASTVRDLVRREAQLARTGRQPNELSTVRTRIAAYCADYTGLDGLVDSLRSRFRVPTQTPA